MAGLKQKKQKIKEQKKIQKKKKKKRDSVLAVISFSVTCYITNSRTAPAGIRDRIYGPLYAYVRCGCTCAVLWMAVFTLELPLWAFRASNPPKQSSLTEF
jgi:hypothetical protein